MTPTGMLAARLPTPLRHRMRAATARLDAVVARVVTARRLTGDTGDVVSMLLAARDHEAGLPGTGAGMTAEQLRDEVLTLLLAGHETTAVALSWAWWELGRHPEVRAELDRELARDSTRLALREAAWDRLPFTRAVFAETLRLHPPAYVTARRATTDVDLGGHRIPRGTGILIAPYALHRDPRSWPDPLAWTPQRWLDAAGAFDEDAPGHPRGAYLPFGAGPRICIGAGFATMEAVLLLAGLASSWRPEIAPGYDPGEQPAVTLRPRHGIPAVLRKA
jgi:cytochrome P450